MFKWFAVVCHAHENCGLLVGRVDPAISSLLISMPSQVGEFVREISAWEWHLPVLTPQWLGQESPVHDSV